MRKGGKLEGWKVEKLSDVVDFQRGLTYSKKDEVDYSSNIVLRATNVDVNTNTLDFSELKYINEKVVVPKERKVRKGSLIICTASGSKSHLGKVALIDDDYDYAFGGFMGQITPRQTLDSKFLFYSLTSEAYKKYIDELSDGANINNLRFDDLANFEIPIPPIPEQQRIVSVLDEAFASIAQAKSNAKRNLVNARELFQSYSQDVFTKRGAGWKEMSLGDVCEFENGDRGKNYPNRHEYVESGIPWINTGHILPNGTLSLSEMNYITQEKFESLRSGKIQPGDLVYCLRGATLGKTAIVDPFTKGAVASSLVIIRAGNLLDNHFLYYFLTSPYGQGLIKLYSNGAAQPNLGAQSVEKYTISLPPLAEQRAIVGRLEALSAETGRLGEIYQQKVESLEELKKSVLAKAFEGEI